MLNTLKSLLWQCDYYIFAHQNRPFLSKKVILLWFSVVALQWYHRQRSEKIVHKGIHYACDICNYKAGEKQCLQEHIISIHKGNYYLCDHQATLRSSLISDFMVKLNFGKLANFDSGSGQF